MGMGMDMGAALLADHPRDGFVHLGAADKRPALRWSRSAFSAALCCSSVSEIEDFTVMGELLFLKVLPSCTLANHRHRRMGERFPMKNPMIGVLVSR